MVLLIPEGIRALKEQSRKEKEAREKASKDLAESRARIRREGYNEGIAQGRKEAGEQSHAEGFQQGYKDGLEQGRKEERQRVIQALTLLEKRMGNSVQITLAPSEYLQILLGETS